MRAATAGVPFGEKKIHPYGEQTERAIVPRLATMRIDMSSIAGHERGIAAP